MLFMIERILSTGADVPGGGLCWLTECVTGTCGMPTATTAKIKTGPCKTFHWAT